MTIFCANKNDAFYNQKKVAASGVCPAGVLQVILQQKDDDFMLKMTLFDCKNDDFMLKNDDFLLKNDDFMLKNDEFLLKNDDFMLKNDEFLQLDRVV